MKFYVVLIYVIFSVYLFNSYAKINNKLMKVNDTLLKTCIKSNLNPEENEKYE